MKYNLFECTMWKIPYLFNWIRITQESNILQKVGFYRWKGVYPKRRINLSNNMLGLLQNWEKNWCNRLQLLRDFLLKSVTFVETWNSINELKYNLFEYTMWKNYWTHFIKYGSNILQTIGLYRWIRVTLKRRIDLQNNTLQLLQKKNWLNRLQKNIILQKIGS